MLQTFRILVITALLGLGDSGGVGVNTPAHAAEIPPHTSLVIDQADILPPQVENELRQALNSFQQQNGPQVQVLTLPSLEGDVIEDYSIRVVDQWKLGDEKRDDGVLFLIAVQDRAMRIEVGQGLEGVLPDITAGRIIRDVVTPQFQAGNLAEGVVQGVNTILGQIRGDAPPIQSATHRVQRRGYPPIFIVFLILFWIFGRLGRRRRGFGPGRHVGYWGGGGGFGGGGFGGGFGGGGGGGFSGGGASGRW